jgi:hypothetical protein
MNLPLGLSSSEPNIPHSVGRKPRPERLSAAFLATYTHTLSVPAMEITSY